MMNQTLTVQQVAEIVGGIVEGDPRVTISGLAGVDEAGRGQLTFAFDERRMKQLADCKASAAMVGPGPTPSGMTLIRVGNASAALARLLAYWSPGEDLPARGIAPSAVVAPDAQVDPSAAVGANVVIGPRAVIAAGAVLCPNAVIGADVRVGRETVVFEGVVVRRGCKIGDRVRIGPNSVIGFEGFGYYFAEGMHHRIVHIGDVVIEDDVEIGACTCVDRSKFGSTVIGRGSKIDNQVQIAHNVQVGKCCVVAGQTGIAGSTTLGDYVVVGGSAAIRDNIRIGARAQVAAFTGLHGDVPAGETYLGAWGGPIQEKIRETAAVRKLPELLKRVKTLEARLEALESAKDDQKTR